MKEIIEYILVGLLTSFMYMYVWYKLLDNPYDFKNKKTYIVFVLLSGIIIANYLFNNEFLRISIITIIFMIAIKFLFDEKLNVCVMTAIMGQFVGLLAEIAFALFTLVCLKGGETIIEKYSGSLFAILFLILSNYLLLKINLFKKLNRYLIDKTKNLNKIIFILLSILILLIYNYLIISVYYKINIGTLAIANTVLILIYSIVIFRFLATKNDYNEVSNKYINTLTNLKEYEEILDKYRVLNHENKNQLLTIRSMIVKKDKKIPDYIDTIIDTTIKDNEKLMFDTNIIPAGGLRAIIYSKMSYMQDNNINVKLDIERKVRTIDLKDMTEEKILDICKIVGVFLDNAIEEVQKLDKKEIIIKLYIDNNDFCIGITNNFAGDIDIEKIDNKRYTTKETGHGYGLALVKNIINRNNKLSNERSIYKDNFTQILRIKNAK